MKELGNMDTIPSNQSMLGTTKPEPTYLKLMIETLE